MLLLDQIAAHLEALEETILYRLIDRIQFKFNAAIYQKGEHFFDEYPDLSLLEVRMQYQQNMESVFGRFSVPEERPFVEKLPDAKRVFPYEEKDLKIEDFEKVNLTNDVWDAYLELVPAMCEEGDDGHHGSAVVYDVLSMMAVSERIHYGAFYVAEAKFQADPEKYKKLISSGDKNEMMKALTRQEVEEKILERIGRKVKALQEGVNPELRNVLDAEVAVNFYRDTIIPLTKEGQIRYFLAREEN